MLAVRRQRVQTRTRFVVVPTAITVGCRLARKRRCARTRFIPTDWGLNPEIESLPQRTQKRAMTFSLLYLAPERDAPPLVPYRSRNAERLAKEAEGGRNAEW